MKKGFNILMIVFAAIVVVSCDKTQSYTDMLNAQEKAIDRLIDQNGIIVLNDFPKDSIFKDKEFVKLDNGIYLNIIDRGNKERATLYSTEIQTRFIARMFMGGEKDTATLDILGPLSSSTYPVEFKYGYYTPLNPNVSYYYDMFISPGLAAGLPYVGDSSYVKLIVPFKEMSEDFQSNGTPVYFEKVRYIFKK